MVRAVVVKGHLVDPRRVELEEPVDVETREVEIIVRVAEPARNTSDSDSVAAFLRSLPPGTRSTADIDQQVREERESWG
jgi:hypothetical protein